MASPASGRYAFYVCVRAGPARRASRKLLERIVEFVRLAGGESKIVEYNQEACRLHSFDGKKSLIRSFPSAPAHQTAPIPLVCSDTAFVRAQVKGRGECFPKRRKLEHSRGLVREEEEERKKVSTTTPISFLGLGLGRLGDGGAPQPRENARAVVLQYARRHELRQ